MRIGWLLILLTSVIAVPASACEQLPYRIYYRQTGIESPEARSVVGEIVAFWRTLPLDAKRIVVEGYTDTAGDFDANMALSRLRAEEVGRWLADAGIRPSDITLKWHGETDVAVATGDGVAEPLNRRVTVQLDERYAGCYPLPLPSSPEAQ